MNVVKATRQFEDWLAQRTHLDQKDLRLKHANMKADVFPFLRATYYRWAQIWPQVCPDLAKAPHVLAVGDLHVENFGTWRDIEGRLIWGVNDFDEAWPMAYTIDLVAWPSAPILPSTSDVYHSNAKISAEPCSKATERACTKKDCPFVLGEKHQLAPPHCGRRTPRSCPLLGEDRRTSHSENRMPHQRHRCPGAPHACARHPISPRSPRCRARQSRPRPLCRHCRLAWRPHRP